MNATEPRIVPPSQDPFYAETSTSAPPGTVLRTRRVDVRTGPACEATAVVYAATDTLGRPTAMSGTILTPSAAWTGPGPRPLLGYGVGVHGLSRDAAPSHLLRAGMESELPLIEAALAAGFTVAIADGEGLGMPGPHTYGAGISGGHAILDVVRAALSGATDAHRPHPEQQAGRRTERHGTAEHAQVPVVLWGYSEGGRAAVFAAEGAPDYAPELHLAGVAAGGVPADLYDVARAIDEGPFAGLNLAVLVGLAKAHKRPELLDILTPAGRRAAERAAGLDVIGLVLGCRRPLATLTVREQPWDDPDWRDLLRRERAGQQAPDVPVYLYHADQDEIVPPRLSQELARSYRLRGVPVDLVRVPAPDHLCAAHLGAPDALAWLRRRAHLAARSSRPAKGPRNPEPSGAGDQAHGPKVTPGTLGAA